jgi:hypothetical protein
MENQAEGGDAQQKEESSKRHTYALIRVKKKFKNIIIYNLIIYSKILLKYRIVICMMK